MMILETLNWQSALLASNAILLAVAVFAIARARREMRTSRAFMESLAGGMLQTEPYDDRELRRMFDRRLTMLQKYLEQQVATHLSTPAETPAPSGMLPPRANELPVEYAVRMARSGASVDDLVRGCGLNKGEAQLLMRLHARPAAPAATTH